MPWSVDSDVELGASHLPRASGDYRAGPGDRGRYRVATGEGSACCAGRAPDLRATPRLHGRPSSSVRFIVIRRDAMGIGTPPTVSHVLSRDSHPSCVDATRVACPTPIVDPCRWMAVCPISKPARTLAERLPLDRSSADLPERCDRVDHPATPRVQRDRLCARPRSASDGRATVVGAHQRDRARTPRSARRSGPGRGLRTRTASAACPATPSRSWSRVFR